MADLLAIASERQLERGLLLAAEASMQQIVLSADGLVSLLAHYPRYPMLLVACRPWKKLQTGSALSDMLFP